MIQSAHPIQIYPGLPKHGITTISSTHARNQPRLMVTQARRITPTAPRKPLPKWLTYLWDANISPFSLVRWSGPLGPRLASGWTSRRFSHLPPEQAQALHSYAYSLFRQRGSGEYALSYILAPGAFARSPLIRRIQGIGRQMIAPDGSVTSSISTAERRRENGIPVVLMYGEKDWMDIDGGYAAVRKDERGKRKGPAECLGRGETERPGVRQGRNNS